MCGIYCEFSFGDHKIDLDNAHQKLKLLHHRGPDQMNYASLQNGLLEYNDKSLRNLKSSIFIGQTRLVIEGGAKHGIQPCLSSNKSIGMVYNGEIYNADKSSISGSKKDFMSDTEHLFEGLVKNGSEYFNTANGMYAVVFVDILKQEITISRDRYGKKPLYFRKSKNSLYISSEIKPLLTIKNKINYKTAREYLVKNKLRTSNETFYDGIMSFQSGETICFNLKNGKVLRRSRLKISSQDTDLNNIVMQSIQDRFSKFTPSCVALSGGLDSSIIFSILRKIGKELPTYSIAFKEKNLSEEKYIDALEPKINNRIYPTFEQYWNTIDKVLVANEEPFRSWGQINLYLLYERIKNDNKYKIVYTGQGADEAFCGYGEHQDIYNFYTAINSLLKLKNIISNIKIISKYRYLIRRHKFNILFKRKLIKSFVYQNPLPEYVSYEDRISMRSSLEVRSPFMDPRFINYGLNRNFFTQVKFNQGKLLLRESFKENLPRIIYDRIDKKGFVSPMEEGQKIYASEIKLQIIKNKVLIKNIQTRALNKKLSEFILGSDEDFMLIWRWFIFSKWYDQCIKS
jgi:asparagine synthase (glutamine-hydrolysing)